MHWLHRLLLVARELCHPGLWLLRPLGQVAAHVYVLYKACYLGLLSPQVLERGAYNQRQRMAHYLDRLRVRMQVSVADIIEHCKTQHQVC